MGATERAPGADEVDGPALRQQVAHGRGDGHEDGHVRHNRHSLPPIPWFGSHVRSRLTRVRRMFRLVARLGAVLVPVVLLVPTAAHAEKVVVDDAVG